MHEPDRSTSFAPDHRSDITTRDGAVVARRAHNPKVASSSLAPATTKSLMKVGLFSFTKMSAKLA